MLVNTTDQYGVLATTRYVPRLRLERSAILAQHQWMAPAALRSLAKGRKAMACWDEDSVTMAVEAGRQLCEAVPTAAAELTLTSTTVPFAERLNAGIVAAALGLAATAVLRDVGSSVRAAVSELGAALRRVPGGDAQMLLAAERRIARPASVQEMLYGDGAAGAIVGTGAAIATFVASGSTNADFVDRFREAGADHAYAWEERWVRDEGYMKIVAETIRACLRDARVAPTEVAHFVMPAPPARVSEAVAKRIGIDTSALVSTEHETVGDLGAAQPLAMLDQALRRAANGDLILIAAFGSGCDVLLLRRTDRPCLGEVPDAGRPETSYLKHLAWSGQIDLDWGMRAEMDNKTAATAAWRDHARVSRFEGGRCRSCGALQFPRGHICVNPDCRERETQAPASLADVPARVLSHTSDFLGYTLNPPFRFGQVDFEGGARVSMEFADADSDELRVGTPVRMVYRVKDFDRQRMFRRYFWKATPVRGATKPGGS